MRKFIFYLIILSLHFYAMRARAEQTPQTLLGTPAYQAVTAKFTAVFSPLLKSQTGLTLAIYIEEESPNFGSAQLEAPTYTINFGDELAAQPGITPDAFAFGLCHELGHVLGGDPKKKDRSGAPYWSSAEGQADYFAAKECLPRYFEALGVPADKMTDRVIAAGQDMVLAIYDMFRSTGMKEPKVSTPDLTQASETVLGYSKPQCRLDTVVAGARHLPRPACWYRY